MEGIFVVNTNVIKCSNKEKIFLCKKTKREQKKSLVFYIKKSKKIKNEISWNDSTNDSTLESQSIYEPKKIPSIDEIIIPNFFNDKDYKKESKIQEKLKKYSEVSNVFKDLEDRELYLVSKDSLY
jgi:hypothetical protein